MPQIGSTTQESFDATDGAKGSWPRPRNADGDPLPWTTRDVADPADPHYERMDRSHAQHLCQVCGLPLSADNCYAVLIGVDPNEVPSGNACVEGPGLHGRCLRLSAAVCPPLADAFSGTGPLYGFAFLVDPRDLAGAYSTMTNNALWRAVRAHATQQGRQPLQVPLAQVNVTAPEKETARAR